MLLQVNRRNYLTVKLLSVLLILALVISFSVRDVVEAGIVSDFLGLEGLEGQLIDGATDILISGAGFGGAVYELGNSIYDTGVGLVKVFSGSAKATDYVDLGINTVAAGAIIAGIVTGGASIPVIVAVTVGVKIAKGLVSYFKAYTAASPALKKIASWLKKHIGNPILNFLGVYKPNIYIYNDKDIDVNVRIEPYAFITESIPLYDQDKGWHAMVRNGSINGRNDYLFYEARIPDAGLQREEGFIIHGDTRREDMEKMLARYGFNLVEKDDFLEYWISKLSNQRDYVFFPQENDILEDIMPLAVAPQPDAIFRIWFLIEEMDGDKAFTVITDTEKIARQGYTVVEWGGIMAGDT